MSKHLKTKSRLSRDLQSRNGQSSLSIDQKIAIYDLEDAATTKGDLLNLTPDR